MDTCERDGRVGAMHRLFVFYASALGFSRSAGVRGSGFQWIATVSSGAFGVCMPVGREGERGEYFLFAAPPFIFPGPGGGIFWQISTIGGGAFGGYMATCREGERTELFYFRLRLSIFP